ncbi:hypothetical protein F544_9430 [Bibersteinia trehalosi USDA-ARS-USMARC-190]|uniref:Uncharacterized protein n=1 Tax=Bibersteinia trehalosi USDA-ARS-USMARC-190 TaxID=1263832 RepID=W0R6U4_BIBTR|nr:hypothetical protein [Bibersteinia trehalosi]AHG86172.1 hypothetical protein F544_9430 [Bibersteinia trehalosi USDA-ARS-USMARC-190]
MDAFEARRHKNNFYDAYVNEYKSHLSEVKSFFSELDSVEIRNVVFAFNMRNYDVDSELYSLPMSILERRNGIVFNDDSLVHENYNTSFLRNSVSSHYFWGRDLVKSLSFKIPVEIAEYLYHNDGAIILNVKMNVKINVDCIDYINNTTGNTEEQTRGDCIRKNKRVLPLRNMSYSNVKIDIVEKNDLYNSSAIEHLWEILYLLKKDHSLFLGKEYDVDMNTVLKLHNDRNIIYSTDKVSVEYSSDYKYSPLER